MKLHNRIKFLEEVAYADGAEWGEYVSALCTLANRTDGMSPEFKQAFLKEIEETYKYAKEHTKLETRTVTRTETITELVWID